ANYARPSSLFDAHTACRMCYNSAPPRLTDRGSNGRNRLRDHHSTDATWGSLPEMMRANERILQAAAQRDLTCWVIDHFQFDADPIFECLAFLAYHAGQHPGLRWGTLVLGQGYRTGAVVDRIASTTNPAS